MRRFLLPILLLVLGLASRTLFISRPAMCIGDERLTVRHVICYYEGWFYFDAHPPLGKLLVYGAHRMTGSRPPSEAPYMPGIDYPPAYAHSAGRMLPAILGGLLPLLIFAIARALSLSPLAAFLAGALALLDTALLTDSRFALIDIFVPVFGWAGLLCYLLHHRFAVYSRNWWLLLGGAGLGAALAVSVKWSGATSAIVMVALAIIEAVNALKPGPLLARVGIVMASVILVYFSSFAIHFSLLPNPGPGDRYVLAGFREKAFLEKWGEVNGQMLAFSASPIGEDRDASRPWEWLVGRKPVELTREPAPLRRMAPNPVVWIFGTLGLIGTIALFFRRKETEPESVGLPARDAMKFLVLVFVANFVPFFLAAGGLFIHHYFTALIAALLMGSYIATDRLPPKWSTGVVLVAAVIGFICVI